MYYYNIICQKSPIQTDHYISYHRISFTRLAFPKIMRGTMVKQQRNHKQELISRNSFYLEGQNLENCIFNQFKILKQPYHIFSMTLPTRDLSESYGDSLMRRMPSNFLKRYAFKVQIQYTESSTQKRESLFQACTTSTVLLRQL